MSNRKSRDEYLGECRAIYESLRVLDDGALLSFIASANVEQLPALSLIWLYYYKKETGRGHVCHTLLDRLLTRGLQLGYFNLIRVMAYEHVDSGAVSYDAQYLISEVIAEVGVAIVQRPSTQEITSWVRFCRSRFFDIIGKLDRHEVSGANGRVSTVGPEGQDLVETAKASTNPGTEGSFAARPQAFEHEDLLDHLRSVVRRSGDSLMLAVAEALYFGGAPPRGWQKMLAAELGVSRHKIYKAQKKVEPIIKAALLKEYGPEIAHQFARNRNPETKKQYDKHSRN